MFLNVFFRKKLKWRHWFLSKTAHKPFSLPERCPSQNENNGLPAWYIKNDFWIYFKSSNTRSRMTFRVQIGLCTWAPSTTQIPVMVTDRSRGWSNRLTAVKLGCVDFKRIIWFGLWIISQKPWLVHWKFNLRRTRRWTKWERLSPVLHTP